VVQHDYAAPSGGSVPDCDNQQIENGSRCSLEEAITKTSREDAVAIQKVMVEQFIAFFDKPPKNFRTRFVK